jgi:uncharacterized protein (UPF0147 family)
MPKLSAKTKLIRKVAREIAEEMAAEGDRSILDAAEALAGSVNQVSVDGALEVLFGTALWDMRRNGKASEVASVESALNRYNQEARDV